MRVAKAFSLFEINLFVIFCLFSLTNQVAADITTGLAVYHSFDDGTAKDMSGNGNDGIVQGATAASGKLGQSLSFDGGDKVTSDMNFPSNGTIAFWTKGDFVSNGASRNSLFDKFDSTRDHIFIRTHDNTSGNIQVVFQGIGGYRFSSFLSASNNKWNHIIVSWDTNNDVGNVYLNGDLITTRTISDSSWIPREQKIVIGNRFVGAIDEFRLYNRVLGQQEVTELVQYGFPALSLELTAKPPIVDFNEFATISWSASNATSCEASGDWHGNKQTTGAEKVGPIISSNVFTLSCFGEVTKIVKSTEIIPDMLSVIGEHPRVYLDDDKLTEIKSKLGAYPYSKFWSYVKTRADRYSNEITPTDITTYGVGARTFGDRIPFIAFAYLLTHEQKYLNGVRKWMNALSSYPKWGDDSGLVASHLLSGMSIAYDWLYNDFTALERETYRTKIAHHADILHTLLVDNSIWWVDARTENHNYVNVQSIAVAGMALYGEDQRSGDWIFSAKDNFDKVLNILSPDGASHESFLYWRYSVYALLKYYGVVSPLYGFDAIKQSSFFQNAIKFRTYVSTPDYLEGFNFADGPRILGGIDGARDGYNLRALARIFRNGHAQWLVNKIEEVRGDTASYSWLDFIWHDETVSPVNINTLPVYNYFDNLGLFMKRSSWDEDALATFFKAGPFQGKLAEQLNDYSGLGHVHPDNGSFMLWNNGEWLIMDHGYTNLKRTENHNVLLFNGVGQIGEGSQWFDSGELAKTKGTVDIIHKDLTDGYQYFVVELSKIYKQAANVKKWQRSFISLPQEYVIIKDDVELFGTGNVKSLIHAEKGATVIDARTIRLNAVDDTDAFVLKSIYPESISYEVQDYSLPPSERRSWAPATIPDSTLITAELAGVSAGSLITFIGPHRSKSQYTVRSKNNGNVVEIIEQDRVITVDLIRRSVKTTSTRISKPKNLRIR